MNNIGFKDIKDIKESKLDLTNDIIYNKYFKDEKILDDIKNITFDDCIFENITYNSKINNCIFTNCKFINCDLTNVEFFNCGLHYITITNSKLLNSTIDSSL